MPWHSSLHVENINYCSYKQIINVRCPDKYRCINKFLALKKNLEKAVYLHLRQYIVDDNILAIHQSGFWKNTVMKPLYSVCWTNRKVAFTVIIQ